MLKNILVRTRPADAAKLIIAAILITILILYSFIVAIPEIANIRSTADSMRGEVMFSAARGFDYKTDLFLLNGEWEYYPNEFLYPADFKDNPPSAVSFVKFPHFWRDDPDNFPEGKGYATYRIIFNTPEDTEGAGVYAQLRYGAHRVFLNGNLISEFGNLTKNLDNFYFAHGGGAGYDYSAGTTRHEVIIQVQSYDHVNAGLANRVIIGSPRAVSMYHIFLNLFLGMTVGILAAGIFYFILLFITSPRHNEYINFAIVAISCMYLTLGRVGDNYLYFVTPTVNPHILYKLEFISVMVCAYFATIHIARKYIKFKHTVNTGRVYTIINCIIIALLPTYLLSSLLPVFSVATSLFIIVAIAACVKNLLKGKAKRNPYMVLEFIALIILMGGAAVSVIWSTVWKGFDLLPMFTIIYSFIHIFIFSEHYKENEKNFTRTAKILEKRVSERTTALADAQRRIQSANDFKTEFLTRVSNEIRTPMNAIVGMSDLFNTDNLNDTQKKYFKDIKDTSYSLLQLINDIMDFSRIETGQLEIIPSHFKFNTFFENICTAAKYSASTKGVAFEYHVADGIPEVIFGDEVRMKQAIANIISNAVKYTNEGYIKIEVSPTSKPDNPEAMLLFTITDTGVGISEEALPKLFDAFTNPNSIKPQHRMIAGTGLGLAICAKLTAALKGKVEVESELGKGSKFKLYFPLRRGDVAQVVENTVSEKIYAKNAKILLVEDNAINITVALGILATHDITPDVAKDGFRAIEMVKEKDYDLVFMDQFMPGIDGTDTMLKIRELGDKYANLPIIAMTSNVVTGARDMMIFKGMNDYLAKPVDQNALNNVLIRWLPHTKISSTMGNFGVGDKDDLLDGLPHELVDISDLNCSEALKNMEGNISIYMNQLNRLACETEDYIRSLEEYLENEDDYNYHIVINGIKSLLYSVGAKACGDMASQLEKAIEEKNIEYCRSKNGAFAESLSWLSQRIALALPYKNIPE